MNTKRFAEKLEMIKIKYRVHLLVIEALLVVFKIIWLAKILFGVVGFG